MKIFHVTGCERLVKCADCGQLIPPESMDFHVCGMGTQRDRKAYTGSSGIDMEVALRGAIAAVEELEQRIAEDRELLAQWMIANGYATGHGDTVADLISELDWQHKERQQRIADLAAALTTIKGISGSMFSAGAQQIWALAGVVLEGKP